MYFCVFFKTWNFKFQLWYWLFSFQSPNIYIYTVEYKQHTKSKDIYSSFILIKNENTLKYWHNSLLINSPNHFLSHQQINLFVFQFPLTFVTISSNSCSLTVLIRVLFTAVATIATKWCILQHGNYEEIKTRIISLTLKKRRVIPWDLLCNI